MTKLTKKDKQVLDFIEKYILYFGYSPSYREIGDGTGLSSTSSVHAHVQRLIDAGAIESSHDQKPRTLRSPRIILTMNTQNTSSSAI